MEKLQLNNAKARKRMLAFLLDSFFVNVFRIFLQLIVIPNSLAVGYNESLKKFIEIFPDVTPLKLNTGHTNFFIQTPIYTVFFRTFILFTFSGILYNILCYCFLKKRTLAQKLLSLRVVNFFNNDEASVGKLIARAILTPLPIIIMLHLTFYQLLFFFNFHVIAPKDLLSIKIITFFVTHINPYIIMFMGTFFFLFWYNLYFLTNKLILSDIISRTRVIDAKSLIDLEKLKSEEKTENLVVSFGDGLLSKMEKVNKTLSDLVSKAINYIVGKFKKNKNK